jgi:MFS transporter, putative metabolite:H+ symporter
MPYGVGRVPVAARIERLPNSRYMIGVILLISLGTFFDSYMLFTIGPISAHFFVYLDQKYYATMLPFALFLGTFVGAITLSTVADKIGRRNAFTLDLIVLALGNVGAVLAQNGIMLLIAIFVAGIGTGAELPLSSTYTQELSPARVRGKMTSLQLTFGFLGGTVGGFIALLVVPMTNLPIAGFKIALLIAAVGGFSSLLIRMKLPESPRWLERIGRLDEADRIITMIEEKITAEKGEALPPPPLLVYNIIRPVPISTLLSRQYLRRTLSASIIELMAGFGAYGFTTFVPLILYSRGYTIVHALAYTAIIQISSPIGPLLSVFVTDRLQRKWGMALLFTLNALAGLGFLLANNEFLILLFGFLTELMIFLAGPLLHTYEVEIFPTAVRARGAGFSFAFGRLGGFLAPIAAAAILEIYPGGGSLIEVAASAWLICALTAATLAVDTTKIPLEGLEAGEGELSPPRATNAAALYGEEG